MAIILISVFMGIVPMVAYAIFLWWLDRWEKEPLHLLAAAFLWGFIPSAIFALITQLILDIPTSSLMYYSEFAYDIVMAGIIAPFTEETIKGVAVLVIFIFFQRYFIRGLTLGAVKG